MGFNSGFKTLSERTRKRDLKSGSLETVTVKSLHKGTGKVKCTLVQALRLCTGCTAHRGSTGIAVPFLDHGTRRG